LDGIAKMFKADAHITLTYFLTHASAYERYICVNEGEEGFKAIFENL
jgi:hypothetical protein